MLVIPISFWVGVPDKVEPSRLIHNGYSISDIVKDKSPSISLIFIICSYNVSSNAESILSVIKTGASLTGLTVTSKGVEADSKPSLTDTSIDNGPL